MSARLNVLVLCEVRGTIREAFADRGHIVTSVDLLPATDGATEEWTLNESGGQSRHIVSDALAYATAEGEGWDLVIARPTCTYLTNAGVRWLFEGCKVKNGEIVSGTYTQRAIARWDLLAESIAFFNALKDINTGFLAIENPIPHKYARDGFEDGVPGIGAPTQVVQPWMFGHTEKKGTGWWLKGLPKLRETNNVKADMAGLPKSVTDRVHYASPGPDRWSQRSLLVEGMAHAIADQWGSFAVENIDWDSTGSTQGYIETGRHNTKAETLDLGGVL